MKAMLRDLLPYLLICSITILAFAITFERMHTPIPTTTELRAASNFGVTKEKPTPPRSFTFDGCTLFPDQVFGTSFRRACLEHDIAYWYGGTAAERKQADLTFKEALAKQGILGTSLQYPMYWSVRLFGDTFLLRPINANWGFGYNEER